MQPVPIIIGAIVTLCLVLAGLLVGTMVDFSGGRAQLSSGNGSAIDSTARIEIETQRQRIDALESKIASLESQIAAMPRGGGISQNRAALDGASVSEGQNGIQDAYAQTVLIADRREVNRNLTVATPGFLESLLGKPREVLSDDCEPMTNPRLKSLLVLERVGPIRVRLLRPAMDSLGRIFAKIEAADPDLYARISTAGSLCVRQIRGTRGRTSSHAFGLALDINIDGQLDRLGDGKTQLGLTIIKDFFAAEGWIWGAGFGREDSMHFEVSRETLQQWRKDGLI